MVGKPVVRGTRIPVNLVLGHLAHNPDHTCKPLVMMPSGSARSIPTGSPIFRASTLPTPRVAYSSPRIWTSAIWHFAYTGRTRV